MINCNLKCCLPKGHEDLLKCNFKECKCKCRCECKCEKNNNNNHKHICYKCKNKNKKECECECNCKHFCKYPIPLHNFICVCLDFEGLGTFERTNEQDIQMALIGSAMGNNIIFRINNSYDRFTETTLENLALGSRKIKSDNIENFFGGSLFFCPRDVIKEVENLKKELSEKVRKSVNKWINNIKKNEEKIKMKYNIFGLFNSYCFAFTPPYPNAKFYKYLRNTFSHKIIDDILKFQKQPINKTGKDFYSNLKLILSSVYMNNYEVLSNRKEKDIEFYINKNKLKAFEVIGVYEDENDSKQIEYLKDLRLYFNKNYLNKLEINFSFNKTFENNDLLIIEQIVFSDNIKDNYNIEEYGINLKIDKKEDNTISLSILNFSDYGLILMIPKGIKEINKDCLCSDLFKLWENICKKMKIKEKNIIDNFQLFIYALIKRRNDNVNKWLQELTQNYNNLKQLQKLDSPLNNIWIICQQKCRYCYYNCNKLEGHKGFHECPYDHKCKEECSICQKYICNEEKNCLNKCNKQSGHSDLHICNHFHQCPKFCKYNPYTNDCEGRCYLEYNHEGIHICKLKNHHCKMNCSLKDIAKNCGGICKLEFPHEGNHNCGETHYCLGECAYLNNSKGCKKSCNLFFEHKNKHNCNEQHYCIQNCYLKDISNNCDGKCIYPYPHEGKDHNCGNIHFCKNKCDLIGIKGCKEYCKLKYGHKENHNCEEKHFCMETCYLKGNAPNCNGKCALEYNHNGIHNCNIIHLCNKKCSLIDISSNCKKECSLVYGHKNKCSCNLKENHKCNKTCNINMKCSNMCILEAFHSGKCLCGKCKCPENCKYKKSSRNCYEKCKFKGGHQGNKHICQNEKHLCILDCCFAGKSINCNQKCNIILEENPSHNRESIHICEYSKKDHGCNGICYLAKVSRGCQNNCVLEVNHKKEHECKTPLEKHLCLNNCEFYGISSNCKEKCNKNVMIKGNHLGNHLCSLEEKEHKCNKKCSLYEKMNDKCKENCSLYAKHEGECICYKAKSEHICNNICDFFLKSNGCNKYCNLPLGHLNGHICKKTKEQHNCIGYCSLKNQAKNCLGYCSLSYGHSKDCICDAKHICNNNCFLFGKSCKGECQKSYGHQGYHLCTPLNVHKCPNNCYYYSIYEETNKGECQKSCSLKYGHKKKCICKSPHSHPCIKKCSLYDKSRGCNEECSLEDGHLGKCICYVKRDLHTCKEKCILCNNDEIECGDVYNHINEDNLKCNKCKGNFCKLTKKKHLCGGQHNCQEKCQIDGFCVIENYIKEEERFIENMSGEKIQCKIIKFQEKYKKQCIEKIPINEFNHSGNHHCGKDVIHKCGYQCIQCEYYCSEPKGHNGLHNCVHGNIKNSYISISNSNETFIKKGKQYFTYKDGEKPEAYFCDEYCCEIGQGHTHLFSSLYQINNNKNVRLYRDENLSYVYECKCSYFWETILKFKGIFKDEDKNKFNLCNWYCTDEKHSPKEFCQLTLWHDKYIGNSIPKEVKGKWITSQGHILNCIHPKGVYTIFLIDQSGSMESNSIRPNKNEIKRVMDNMLGCAIEAIINYCNKRNSINPKDKCALIGYNDKASLIFDNMFIGEINEIKKNCLIKLKPEGCTYFINAFKEAKKIIENINDRNEYRPVIILLTDGLDFNYEETINYIKNDVSNFLYNSLYS